MAEKNKAIIGHAQKIYPQYCYWIWLYAKI